MRHGRKWVDPHLLRHLAMAERPSQIASSLTSREAEITRLVTRGLRNKEIAHEAFCSFRAPEPANFEALGAPTRCRSISHDARGPPWAPT